MFSERQIVAVSLVLMLIAATSGCSREGAVAQKRAEQIQQDGDGACCAGHDSQDLKTPELLVTLPTEHVNTPDAMCLLPDGNLILTVPNFNNLEQQPLLMKITPENQAEVFYMLPDHPETGEPFGSLGVWPAPDGDLFVCDYQMTADGMGRVVRILVEDGRAVGSRPVITGFNIPNGLITRGEHLYVADTQLDASQTPVISGVFRFALADLEGDEPVKLAENLLEDTRLLGTIETHDETLPLGADGLCFDKAGNLYVSNFADGTVHRFEFDDDGRVTSNTIFARAEFMKSADGMEMDPETGVIYVADSRANAVQMVYPDGTVKTLAQNDDTDGADGSLDQPCEVRLRGRELIVSNMDWPVPGTINTEHDEPHTLSVIRLDD
jgi:YD repeat-containing protein